MAEIAERTSDLSLDTPVTYFKEVEGRELLTPERELELGKTILEGREAILQAARRVFLSGNLQQATVETVAQEAGVSKGTVYLYFPSKEALLAELLREGLQLLEDDYLGGQGSRGSGKILFQGLSVSCRARNNYGHEETWEAIPAAEEDESQVAKVLKAANRQALQGWLKDKIKIEDYQPAES